MAVTIVSKGPSLAGYSQFLGPTMSAKNVAGTVLIQKKGAGHPEGQAQTPVHPGVMGECRIGVGGSRTVNLGNYESVKISVNLEMPAPADGLFPVYEFCTSWVSARLSEALAEAGKPNGS